MLCIFLYTDFFCRCFFSGGGRDYALRTRISSPQLKNQNISFQFLKRRETKCNRRANKELRLQAKQKRIYTCLVCLMTKRILSYVIICSHANVYCGKISENCKRVLYKKRKVVSGQINLSMIKSLLMHEYRPINEDYPDVVMGL